MLRHLSIRDFAIIDALDLEVDAGFTVLSGETGAGKSILIDALGLLLGDRADGAMVRAGRERAELSAEFDIGEARGVLDWLKERSLDDPDAPRQCVVRRTVQSDGRTRAFVNGAAATINVLRELGEQLVEIHGQHEHQRLMRADIQRDLLDESGGHAAQLAAVHAAATDYQQVEQAIERARAAAGRDPAQLDYLRFQLQELDALNLQAGELEALDREHRQLANGGRLLQDGGQVQELLYGGDRSIHDQLSGVGALLRGIATLHPDFEEAEKVVAATQDQIREAADQVRRALDRLDLDPARLAEVDRRLTAVHDLARKHRVKAEALAAHIDALRRELGELEQAASGLEAHEARRQQVLEVYNAAARRLSEARQKAAAVLSRKATEAVRELGMAQARFVIALESQPREKPRATGDDDVRFDFSANPGQPPRPLAKVASGGELSRLSLAIQVTASQTSAPLTMIFDEVDSGIGGGVAEIVGQKLRGLAAGRQVLCVTHLPQVAAQGQQHFSVRKEVKGAQTFARVLPLGAAERSEELARMLGGVEITAQTRAHAKEMLSRAKKVAR